MWGQRAQASLLQRWFWETLELKRDDVVGPVSWQRFMEDIMGMRRAALQGNGSCWSHAVNTWTTGPPWAACQLETLSPPAEVAAREASWQAE